MTTIGTHRDIARGQPMEVGRAPVPAPQHISGVSGHVNLT